MLLKDLPVSLDGKLFIVGSARYPLFLYKGDGECAIFEGGTSAMGPLVQEQVAALGIDEGAVKQVIVTHAHPDHVMAIPYFRKVFPGITILASAVAAKTLAAEKAISFFCKIDGALTASLTKAGVISDERHGEPPAATGIAVDRVVKEGDTISVGSESSFTVLETPGHSDCSLSFYEPARKTLIISDATGYYMPEHNYWWPNYFSDYAAYLSSMERLAGLEAEILCLSHNGVITGADEIRSYLTGAIAATKAYHAGIVERTNSGTSVSQLAEELGSEVHAKTPLLPLPFFQKNCELLVKQSLAHEGISS